LPRRVNSDGTGGAIDATEEGSVDVFTSSLRAATLEGEDALRAALNEDDDENKHDDLGEHSTGPAFEELVQYAEAEARVHRACQLTHATEHHHHERVHDVALTEIGADVAHLR